ncbi:MAG: HNH endonuclease signature motif containing protein [Pseudomonadota bacterium]
MAWLMQTGEPAPDHLYVDHKDGNRSNDAWDNLRLVTPAQNNQNRNPVSSNSSGRLGVYELGNRKFSAEIWADGEHHRLGRFECIEAAIEARCEAEKHHFGSFRRMVETHSGEAS